MNGNDSTSPDTEAPRAHDSRLGAAILRISASLDVATVLQEVVDSARALTGARYGVIATVGDTGEVQDFVTSGFTPEEHEQLASWTDGPRLFEHLRDLPGPLRLADLHEYVRSLGFSPDLMVSSTLQGVPMRHRGEHVGHFFLAGKGGGGEFTPEDEELLVLFASQAATAIVNARTHRDEQRARADLEALIDTSPVGVVVFDARTGRPLSSNREANRIVEPLRTPGRPAEELLEVLTCRLADGREVALDRLPIAEALKNAGTVRAEEIVLSVPDGRRVSMLVNATPIQAEDGTVATVVVTLQDLAPLEELDRLRAEFLGMVSHELRTPLATIRGSTTSVLGAVPPLPLAEVLQFFRIVDDQAGHMQRLIGNLLDAGSIEAGTLTVAPEPSDIAALVDQARNTFLVAGGRHHVVIDLPPELPRAMADRQRIVQVLNNLLSNAARHCAESSPIAVAAARDGAYVAVSVSDRGRGIAPERLGQLFRKHARVAGSDREAGIGGTGLGLAICKGLVEAHGGRIRAESAGEGQGARFTFTIPVAGPVDAVPEEARTAAQTRRDARAPIRILVVDDDPQTLRYVRDVLSQAGYAALATADPGEFAALIRAEKPALVLLDLVLPGTDGIELMETVPELSDLPVIFLSAYGRDETVARALEAGADDYIVKPFSPTELTARIEAALRRTAGAAPFVLGELAIDYERSRASVAGRELTLTPREYELLRILSVNAGRVVTSESLLRQAWSERNSEGTEPVRAFVKQLRAKLGDDAANPAYIFTERGVGYRVPRPGDP